MEPSTCLTDWQDLFIGFCLQVLDEGFIQNKLLN